MKKYRRFNGQPYELQPRTSRKRKNLLSRSGKEITYSTPTDSAYFVKSDAKKEASKRRKAGNKVRIVESRNVKFFGGDIAFFIYQKLKGESE
tara:strand:- start:146 stop:421 length:276 start_codon:yes stop_codon:yes gene_type:complete